MSTTFYNKNYICSASLDSSHFGFIGNKDNPTILNINTTLCLNFNDSGGIKSYISIIGIHLEWQSQKTIPIIDVQAELISYTGTSVSLKVYSNNAISTPNKLIYLAFNWLIFNTNYYSNPRIAINTFTFDKATQELYSIPS